MAEHSSDCALHNAPAEAPGPCSCGASMRFRLYEYDICTDNFRWRKLCREALVADMVGRALAHAYGRQEVVRTSTLIARAIASGLTGNETAAVAEAWASVWRIPDRSYLDRLGVDDVVAYNDGKFISAEDRAMLAAQPDAAEIRSVMAPWIEYWATLPEPNLALVRLAA